MNHIPRGHSAVMANRVEPPDSLDLFATPPWATRALCEHVLNLGQLEGKKYQRSCWDPCAGKGHMSEVLKEYFQDVRASDVFDYGGLDVVGSFVGDGAGSVHSLALSPVDWICCNPPYNLAMEFCLRALSIAREGVAVLVRSVWVEGVQRYEWLFKDRPPEVIAQFAERVPMVKGKWNPDGSTATSYAWLLWRHPLRAYHSTTFLWIPPGCRTRLTRKEDRARFAAWSIEAQATPLLEGRG